MTAIQNISHPSEDEDPWPVNILNIGPHFLNIWANEWLWLLQRAAGSKSRVPPARTRGVRVSAVWDFLCGSGHPCNYALWPYIPYITRGPLFTSLLLVNLY